MSVQRFGRYYLVRPIASGGMADVWLALNRPPIGPPRLVVIKRIVRERIADARFIELFVQEGRLSTLLEHPNVVRTIEMGLANSQYFIALEYLRGQTVLALLTRATELKRFLPFDAVLRVVRDVMQGLGYAHQARDRFGEPLRLVHRDISPSNLFATYDGHGKVLDFGIARAGDAAAGRAPVKGKLPYVSPEQAQGKAVDARSDLFAVGIVMHEMLTLRPLFRGTNDLDTIRRVLEGPVPRPASLRKSIPAAMDDLVMSLLEREPSRRPADAATFIAALDRAARRMGLDVSGTGLADTLAAMFPEERAATLSLSAESVATTAPASESASPLRPPRRAPGPRGRTTTRRRTEVTPAPA